MMQAKRFRIDEYEMLLKMNPNFQVFDDLINEYKRTVAALEKCKEQRDLEIHTYIIKLYDKELEEILNPEGRYR